MKRHFLRTKGYTFVELMVAISIFSVVMIMVASIAINFNASQQRERARNLVIEETQFLLSRITEAIRINAIDYSEYYSNYTSDPLDPPGLVVYGDDPREYEWHFYDLPLCDTNVVVERHGENHGPDGITCDRDTENKFFQGYFSTGADKDINNNDPDLSALVNPTGEIGWSANRQVELYLISADGLKKTIFRRSDNGIDDDSDGQIDENSATFWKAGADGNTDGGERLEMLVLEATRDTDSDGYIDFEPTDDFPGGNFIPITPKNIDIVNLEFYISPLDDPRKATAETGVASRVQPHVTILLTTRAGASLRGMNAGDTTLSLQTTVSSRILTDISFPDLQ